MADHSSVLLNERYHQEVSELNKEMMIKAALNGQPASGVGHEIQRKRQKLKDIYR